ncbi:hypothetical protein TrispH2_012078 [Trichoplax sp. H2]|nr:hypothetical protein TrispH2_012078 [Trichoplax sp. H2]|eukprot:RDD36019.1 hypothetical protein TrispH2_012078 [Trichoplax sp. H2]
MRNTSKENTQTLNSYLDLKREYHSLIGERKERNKEDGYFRKLNVRKFPAAFGSFKKNFQSITVGDIEENF